MALPARAVEYRLQVTNVDALTFAVDRGTFPQYVAQRAKAVGGMSFVVGQGHDPFYDPDRLYVLLTLQPAPHTFKVVIGWRDHDNRGDG
jgi:hypothetical protein